MDAKNFYATRGWNAYLNVDLNVVQQECKECLGIREVGSWTERIFMLWWLSNNVKISEKFQRY